MPDFLAVKRLSASDLTFFESLFRTQNAGNQKSINLNADVLTGILYPALDEVAARSGGEIRFPLTIYGPNAARGYRLTRKIIKNVAYKNWRLNGEFVFDPADHPGRFNSLVPGDLAVFGFDGRLAPEAVTMVLLSGNAQADGVLHTSFADLVAGTRRTMAVLTQEQISAALQEPGVPADHPLDVLVAGGPIGLALEDAAQGGFRGIRALRGRRAMRPVTAGELEQAKRNMERTGAEGEALVDAYLLDTQNEGGDFQHDWVSSTNAIAPYDFLCTATGGDMGNSTYRIDVKTTRGPFEGDFHLSLGEVKEAASGTSPYYIWRVYGLNEDGAFFRRSSDISGFAASLLEAHDGALPGRVQADSFSVPVDTRGLSWSAAARLERLDPDEDGS